MKIVILGAGVAGTHVAVELERLLKKRRDVEVTLVSRDNFYLMTPLLFEAASGAVEVRHVVNPIRPLLRTTQFVRAEVTRVDLSSRQDVTTARSARARGGKGARAQPGALGRQEAAAAVRVSDARHGGTPRELPRDQSRSAGSASAASWRGGCGGRSTCCGFQAGSGGWA